MLNSLWIDDARIAVLTDNAIEATDIVDLARRAGRGPAVLMRKSQTLVSLLLSGECTPSIVILGSELSSDDARTCIDAAASAKAKVIILDQPEHADLSEHSNVLLRPFGVTDLRAAFRKAGVHFADE